MFLFLLSILVSSNDKYAIVIDAGSTKTNCYIYSYSDSDVKPNLISSPSKDVILYNVLLSDSTKKQLFDSSSELTTAASEIPSESRSSCSFTLLASCLRDFPQAQIDSIFTIYREYLTTTSVWKDFSYDDSSFQVLSSQLEATLLWIAINHQSGVLSSQDEKAILSMSSTAAMLGFQEKTKIKDGYHAKITVRKSEYKVFVGGFDRFGINSAIKNASISLSSIKGHSSITSPCFLTGEVDKPFPKDYGEQEYRFPLLYIKGEGNYDNCADNFLTSILAEGECTHKSCFIDNAPYYNLPDSITLLGTFSYLKSFFSELTGTYAWTSDKISDVVELGKKYCSKNLDDEPNGKYTDEYCYQFVYTTNFLTKVLKYDTTFVPNWSTESISWTYSVVLQRALGKDFKIKFIPKKKDYTLGIIIGVVVAIFFIAIVAYVILKFCKRGSKKNKNEEEAPIIENNNNEEGNVASI